MQDQVEECPREVLVHWTPALCAPEMLTGGVAVVVDVLRATTTIVHALAAGAATVRPCAEVEEARGLAASLRRSGPVLLGGERDGKPLSGFDAGNSPLEYTESRCRGATVVFTTSNGTRALLHALAAYRVLVAGFVNLGAVSEHLRREARPIHIICAGDGGAVALEDALLAGAFADFLADLGPVRLNDAGRLAWAGYQRHRGGLEKALTESAGGVLLRQLGYAADVAAAARVNRFALAPELIRDPPRVVAAGGSQR